MAMNRVQFQRGLSMAEFIQRYGTDDKCEQALVASRWADGFRCEACGGQARSTFRRDGRLYWQCADCPHQTSLISGTIFQASKLPLSRWFLAMHLLTQAKNNVSALELKRHLGVCYRTAWLVKHKLLEVMRLREEDRQLTGRVEIDDAYLGGERSGGKPGRGSENKIPFVAAVMGWVVLRERVGGVTLLASLVAFAGVAVTMAAGVGEGSPLGHVAHVGRGMRLQVGGGCDHVARTDHPADPPSRHGVRLGHPIDDDAGIGQPRDQRRHRRETPANPAACGRNGSPSRPWRR